MIMLESLSPRDTSQDPLPPLRPPCTCTATHLCASCRAWHQRHGAPQHGRGQQARLEHRQPPAPTPDAQLAIYHTYVQRYAQACASANRALQLRYRKRAQYYRQRLRREHGVHVPDIRTSMVQLAREQA